MMYNEKLVASLKVSGKILREVGNDVFIPFGSEYSILLKNLNNRKALVNIEIDGTNVTPGGLVLYAGQTVDFERPVTQANKFKFIERTGKIEANRGIKLEDGLVKVSYQFEFHQPQMYNYVATRQVKGSISDTLLRNFNAQGSISPTYNSTSFAANIEPSYDVGITVPGSRSDQKFQTVSSFPVEYTTHVIVLRLRGENVQAPTTVKSKVKCNTCGTLNSPKAKFCSECGAGLVLYR